MKKDVPILTKLKLDMVANRDFKSGFETDSNPDLTIN